MKIVDQYQQLGIIKAGERLFTPSDALNFLRKIEQKGQSILGVDLWCYMGEQLVEDPSSLDLSDINDPHESITISKRFITYSLPQGTTFVSFVLDEEN